MATDLWKLPLHALAAKLKSRSISPIDIVDTCLQRIAKLDAKLHAFVEVFAAEARGAAEAADKAIRSGHAVGPLHGIPIALKDLIELEGRVATGGSAVWREPPFHPYRDACTKADLRRHDRHWQDAHGGVRLWRLGHQPAPGDAVEPLGRQNPSHAGWLQQRIGRGGCGAHGAMRHWHRYRWLGTRAGSLVRHYWPQDHHWPHQLPMVCYRSRQRSTPRAP